MPFSGYLKLNDIDFLTAAWRDDLAYRLAQSIDLCKRGDVEKSKENRQRIIDCATVYVALRELRKEFNEL